MYDGEGPNADATDTPTMRPFGYLPKVPREGSKASLQRQSKLPEALNPSGRNQTLLLWGATHRSAGEIGG